MDAEVGLINMNARLYDPVLGRFISADVTIDTPTDMQTYNRYHYVMNNPFLYTDPSGYGWWSKNRNKVVGTVGMVVGAVLVVIGGFTTLAGDYSGSVISAGISLIGTSNQYYHGNNKPSVRPVTVVSGRTDITSGGGGNTSITTPVGSFDYSSQSGLNYTPPYSSYSGTNGYYGHVGMTTGHMPDGAFVTEDLFVLGDQSIQSTMAPWEIAGGAYGAARGLYGVARAGRVVLDRALTKGPDYHTVGVRASNRSSASPAVTHVQIHINDVGSKPSSLRAMSIDNRDDELRLYNSLRSSQVETKNPSPQTRSGKAVEVIRNILDLWDKI